MAYNRQMKQYLVAIHFRSSSINGNKLVIVTRVIQSGAITKVSRPRLSIRGLGPSREAADLRRSSLIYNPVTYGYVIAAELELPSSVQIIFGHLSADCIAKSSGLVFSFRQADVLQPNLIYDPLTEMIVFASQLDKSHQVLKDGEAHGILLRSMPASENSSDPGIAHLIGYTRVRESSISIHRDNVTGCFRVCFSTDENNNSLTQPTCSKVCRRGIDDWPPRHYDVLFCMCKERVVNPYVIEYPVCRSVFGVWEETDQTRKRLHGYYLGTQNFVQSSPAVIQSHPLASYKSSDGQVCVVWQHYTSENTCRKLAFRCYEPSVRCNDPCCCSYGDHCGKNRSYLIGTSGSCYCIRYLWFQYLRSQR